MAKPLCSVTVPCPRCNAQGRNPNWHPDAGVCYLCGGKKSLEVDIARGERHLAYLRNEYRKARDAGDTEAMERLAKKGGLKRDLVDLAKSLAAKENVYETALLDNCDRDYEGYCEEWPQPEIQ
jgi:hypothetical protein